MSLTREAILSKQDLRRVVVDIPEWGGTVTVQQMLPTEIHLYEDKKDDAPEIARAWMIALSVIDPVTGDRLFRVGDIPALADKSPAAMDRIYEECGRMYADELRRQLDMLARIEKLNPVSVREDLHKTASEGLEDAISHS